MKRQNKKKTVYFGANVVCWKVGGIGENEQLTRPAGERMLFVTVAWFCVCDVSSVTFPKC
jgi:hypothetical protein